MDGPPLRSIVALPYKDLACIKPPSLVVTADPESCPGAAQTIKQQPRKLVHAAWLRKRAQLAAADAEVVDNGRSFLKIIVHNRAELVSVLFQPAYDSLGLRTGGKAAGPSEGIMCKARVDLAPLPEPLLCSARPIFSPEARGRILGQSYPEASC